MKIPTELFRPEAIAYRLNRKRAEDQIPYRAEYRGVAWIFTLLVFSLGLLLCLVEYRETETARGRLVPTEAEQKLVAPKSGVVQQLRVGSGDQVSAGQVVAVVSLSLYGAEGQLLSDSERHFLEKKLQGLREQQQLITDRFTLLQDQLEDRITEQQRKIGLASAQELALEHQIQISSELLAATEILLDRGSVSEAAFRRQELEHLNLVRGLNVVLVEIQENESLLVEYRNQIEESALDKGIAISQVEQEIYSLSHRLEENYQLQTVSVIALRDGFVSALPVKEGEAVSEGQTLLYIQPNNQNLLAEIYVPSSVVARLFVGQEVLIRYDAFDFHTYGRYFASIEYIGRSSLDSREHLIPVSHHAEPVFPVLVKPDQHYVEGSEIYPLQAGLLLEADFVIAEMSLVELIFKPVLSLRGKLT